MHGQGRRQHPDLADLAQTFDGTSAIDIGIGRAEDEFSSQIVGKVIGDIEFWGDRLRVIKTRAINAVYVTLVFSDDAESAHTDLPR
ncbi:hypothetical protein D9M69_681100 [compost metagenome]